MGALTNYYVDPAINANSGAGTIGDPYGDLQYALDTITRDATNGDQINVKAGTDEVLTGVLSFASYGTPSLTAPLVIRGYTTAANDGGRGVIDGNGGACVASLRDLHLIDMEFKNGGSSNLVTLGAQGSITDCKVSDTSGIGINAANSFNFVIRCEITDCGTGIGTSSSSRIYGCYLKAGSIRNFTIAINNSSSAIDIIRNIISLGTSGTGISSPSSGARRNFVANNSILANGSDGFGIDIVNAARAEAAIYLNNIVEGFTGSGGASFNFRTATIPATMFEGNASYNSATHYLNMGDAEKIYNGIDNETLSASPFVKSGSDTFANRFAYFAPVDTGNVRGGAIQ